MGIWYGLSNYPSYTHNKEIMEETLKTATKITPTNTAPSPKGFPFDVTKSISVPIHSLCLRPKINSRIQTASDLNPLLDLLRRL